MRCASWKAGVPARLGRRLSRLGHTYFSQFVNCYFFQVIHCISHILSVIFFSTDDLESCRLGTVHLLLRETNSTQAYICLTLSTVISFKLSTAFLSSYQLYFYDLESWCCAGCLLRKEALLPGAYMGTRPVAKLSTNARPHNHAPILNLMHCHISAEIQDIFFALFFNSNFSVHQP